MKVELLRILRVELDEEEYRTVLFALDCAAERGATLELQEDAQRLAIELRRATDTTR